MALQRQRRRAALALALLLVLVAGAAPALAQLPPVPIEIEELVTGEVSAANFAPAFIYAASEPQAINVQVDALTSGFAPALRVLNASGDLVEEFANPGSIGRLDAVALLPQAGPYILQVYSSSGVGGQFNIQIGAALPVPDPLAVGQVLDITLDPSDSVARLAFDAAANRALVLVVETDTPVNAVAALAGESGDELARVSLLLTGMSLDIPPGSGSFILSLFQGVDAAPETVRVALIEPTTTTPPVGATATPTAPPQPTSIPLIPLPSTGPCIVASFSGAAVNVRIGPSTDFEAIGRLVGNDTAQVTGRLPDSSWYQIRYNDQIVWVAAFVTRQGGECGSVPVVAGPGSPLPTATPVPGAGTADLTIAGVSVTPGNPDVNQQFAVNVTISNIGSGTAGNVPVRISFSSQQVQIQAPTIEQFIPVIPPNSSVTVNFIGNMGNQSGDVSGQVTADPNNVVPEINEGNNSRGFNFKVGNAPSLPDLFIPDVEGFIQNGTVTSVWVRVENRGTAATGAFQVSVNLDPSIAPQQILNFGGLNPGQSQEQTVPVNASLNGATQVVVIAVADPTNAIAELNEGNNVDTETEIVN